MQNTYSVYIKVEVQAGSKQEAWELVDAAFRNGSIGNDQPHWLNSLVEAPRLQPALQTIGI